MDTGGYTSRYYASLSNDASDCLTIYLFRVLCAFNVANPCKFREERHLYSLG